ncbi:G-type lectin S-receptor-like serine/threonine-protein kinase SD2-5 [Linum grandiflorum]
MGFVEKRGIFLVSQNSTFGFGFYTTLDDHLFVLVIVHTKSGKAVWTANRGLLVNHSDKFVFDLSGNASLHRGEAVVWTSNTGGRNGERVDSMELMESGNLVLLGGDDKRRVLWESFRHPTDTLLPGQEFTQEMALKSFPNKNNLSSFLQIMSGDLVLYAGYTTPQVYWSLKKDSRRTNNTVTGQVLHSASIVSNSWNFYNSKRLLLWQFKFSNKSDPNSRWAVILASSGGIGFYNLEIGRSVMAEPTKIPQVSCSVPEPCDRYYVCFFDNWCECPASLKSQSGCRPSVASPCNKSDDKVDLIFVGEKLDYFALGFAMPMLTKSNLNVCREACVANCSCIVLFFDQTGGNCFMFDQLGSLNRAPYGSSGYTSYMKISTASLSVSSKSAGKEAGIIAVIAVATLIVVAGLLYLGIWFHFKRQKLSAFPDESTEGDDFFGDFARMPVRYSLEDLSLATKNFTTKIGQGGFGSVYQGVLPDGTQLAVKKLESVGQGKKEFKAEVSIIGSVHHVHLVKLKGFCAESFHRLLVYEFMSNGSLDRWIFDSNKEGKLLLDWNTRFNIALGTAKGLAYLHEECEVKIVHCDIKPQNVLLDENFTAKVSDFGLAKLMNREDSGVYTMVRGTRGYLAPEWISNHPISEKSDVYSYGILLLEIIGGRKNYESEESSERSHFPSYSFKMFEEGKLRDIVDPKLVIEDDNDVNVVNAIKVALWCIQDEMQLRPPMTRVVQMLEGICDVPDPPTPSESCPRPYNNFLKWSSNSSGFSNNYNYNSSSTFVSDSQLSGPR